MLPAFPSAVRYISPFHLRFVYRIGCWRFQSDGQDPKELRLLLHSAFPNGIDAPPVDSMLIVDTDQFDWLCMPPEQRYAYALIWGL